MTTRLWIPPRGIITPKLPSYVKLDMAFALGTGTTLFDTSRYRSHGTISGASWADGLHGKALDFNPATPSYVEIAAAYDQLNFMEEDFSLIARIYDDDPATERYLFHRGFWVTDGWMFEVTALGRLDFRTYQSGARQDTSSSPGSIVAATWYTIGFSRDGASCRIFKNGVDVNETSATHVDPVTCARSAKIGIYDNKTTSPWDGKIEFLRIFGGIALPASAHLAWHNALA